MCIKKVEPKRNYVEDDIMVRKFIKEQSNDYKTGYNNAINDILNLEFLNNTNGSRLENARFRLLKKILMEMKK